MKKKSKVAVIANAFLNKSSEIPDWQQKRLDICATCPLNSINKENANFIDKLKARCTACGCFIHEKTSQKTEMCGKAEIGQDPEWPALTVELQGNAFLDLENESPDKINVDLNEEAKEYEVNYGEVKKGSDSEVSLLFTGKSEIVPISSSSSCSCTTNKIPEQVDDKTIRVALSINTGFVGNIISTVTVYFKLFGQQRSLRIRVKAQIVE